MYGDNPHNFNDIIEGLKRFKTIAALQKSQFYSRYGEEIDSILNHVWQQPASIASPRVNGFIRAVQWNIERGTHSGAIINLFNYHPVLKFADVIAFNEVDFGMNRTGNRNIAFELGSSLGMHTAFAPEYIELTKGIGEEARMEGNNRESMHGNAILSRYPILSARSIRLPSCFNTYQFSEKRYGDRIALVAELDCNGNKLLMVSTHLEVRDTPLCRARQCYAILDSVAPITQNDLKNSHILIAGDLNTGTFKRGHILHTFMAAVRLLRTEPDEIRYALRHPELLEPLFSLAFERGFRLEGFNDDLATCSTPIGSLDEAGYVPSFLSNWLNSRFAVYNNQLDFRLDFFLARGLRPAVEKESNDLSSNVKSLSAHTITGLCCNAERISDHDPIVSDFVFS
jgi:endonuclease/exonuclease/phosphatase family metal-dependent hydrolase